MNFKKALCAGLASLMLISALAGCGNSEPQKEAQATPETTQETAEEEETRIIVDHAGNEVEIPKKINRIVISSIFPLPSVYSLFEGSAEKLVGIHPSSMAAAENSILPQVVPDIVNVNTEFLQGGDLNIEELLELDPDVVFYRANQKEEYEKLKAAGIPAVGFSTTNWDFNCVDTFSNWVSLLGEVLQQEDKAAGIVERGNQVYNEITAKLENVKEEDKPRILILHKYGEGEIKASGSKFFGQYWIESTGGINVASELEGMPDINMEQIYEWDPDIIYITNFSAVLPEDLYNNAIEGHDWSSVKAVQEKHVYKFPLGMYRWFPPASDTPLVLKWLAQKNHPELFKDMDMNEEVKAYYNEFYNMELTEQDLEFIFNPNREASGVK